MGSAKFDLNMQDVKSVVITGLLFGLAGFLTYVMQNLASLHLGSYEVAVTLALGLLLKFVQKFTTDTR